MEVCNLNDWQDFESKIQDLEQRWLKKKTGTALAISNLLFRGQADSSWKLETTLDRFYRKEMSLRNYYRIAFTAKTKIETFTDKPWVIPELQEYEKWVNEEFDSFYGGDFKAYHYFVYLRHHGFPSPLLDWSASPYIALFFAFNGAKKESDCVSIYVFWERPSGTKSAFESEPIIKSLGPNVRSDKRHFLQQSRYTICTVRGEHQVCNYAKHEDIVLKNKKRHDLLWKLNIPVSERRKVLSNLGKMNINAFSLFGTEDSLLETIATDISLKGQDLK
jgi:hypothetical protein